MGSVMVGSRCSDQERVVCRILKGLGKVSSDTQTLVFALSRQLLSGILWDAALKSEGVQETWQVFKDRIF